MSSLKRILIIFLLTGSMGGAKSQASFLEIDYALIRLRAIQF